MKKIHSAVINTAECSFLGAVLQLIYQRMILTYKVDQITGSRGRSAFSGFPRFNCAFGNAENFGKGILCHIEFFSFFNNVYVGQA